MDLKEIKAVIDLMTKNGLSEFELEKQDCKIRIKRQQNGEMVVGNQNFQQSQPTNYASHPHATAPLPTVTAVLPIPPSHPPTPAVGTKEILSPMVGTFYRAPSPDSAAYVEVGQEVNEETVVCIIEAMKVMNEIKAEMRGIITEVLQEGGKPVDFNKPLFRLKPV